MPRSDYYDDEGNLQREQCPRCENSLLADHDDRKYCGKCHYTEWK